MSPRPARPRDPSAPYWVLACRRCFHPGGLHIEGGGCRFCQCPGWAEGSERRWSDQETWDLAGTRDWHEQAVAPFADRTPLPSLPQ